MLGWDPITFWTSTHYDVATAIEGHEQMLEEQMVQQSYLASWLSRGFYAAAGHAFHGKRFGGIAPEKFYRRPEPPEVVMERLRENAEAHRAERARLFDGAAKVVPAAAFRLGRLPKGKAEAPQAAEASASGT